MDRIERKNCPFVMEDKGLDPEARTFRGFAAVMGNLDDGGDVIERGAFKKTIVEMGGRIKVYWIHDFDQPIGKALELAEVPKSKLPAALLERAPNATGGLRVKGYVSQTPKGDEALTLMRDGVLDELSIGYQAVKEQFKDDGPDGQSVRHLFEIALMDISPVPLAMNPAAIVTDVKKVVPFQDLPLADESRPWDAAAARKRLAAWAGGPDKEDVNWPKYRRGFVWVDEDRADSFGGYKLPIADVIDGRLMAVPRGIFAVAVVLQGGRALPDVDIDACKNHVARYYGKMDRDPPWERDSIDDGLMEDFISAPMRRKSEIMAEMFADEASEPSLGTLSAGAARAWALKAELQLDELKQKILGG